MINCQRSCNSWLFPLFIDKFFPIFLFNCQFQLFFIISGKIVNRRSVPFAALFVQFCDRNGTIFGASRHLKDVMKICSVVGKNKQGRNWHVFVCGGGKIGSFGQNIYPCILSRIE